MFDYESPSAVITDFSTDSETSPVAEDVELFKTISAVQVVSNEIRPERRERVASPCSIGLYAPSDALVTVTT